MKFSKTGFTKHTIQTDELEDYHEKTQAWNRGKTVWCKLDNESPLVKRSLSGVRMQYVWMLSENLKRLCLVPLENARVSQALLTKVQGKAVKDVLQGEELNLAYTKIRKEATRLLEMKKRQAVISYGSQKKKSGWAYYTYRHNTVNVKMNGKSVMKLERDDKFKIKRVGTDKNILVFFKDPDTSYYVDDLKLCLLITRSANWLAGKFV